MKKLGLVQPGKIGDILICLPIAKWYADKGYVVVWPIHSPYIDHFQGRIHYVTFVPIPELNATTARNECINMGCSTIIDVSFNLPGSNHSTTLLYNSQDRFSFDELKYELANVPFYEKWNLHIDRDYDKEEELKDKVVGPLTEYVTICNTASDYTRNISWENPTVPAIHITPIPGYSVLDWIGILEGASQHILIESCFSNLVDQMDILSPKKVLLLKDGYYGNKLSNDRFRGMPVLRQNWIHL